MNKNFYPLPANGPRLQLNDWGSMARQWASLRSCVNIPQSVSNADPGIYQVPPPPPPPPLPTSNIASFTQPNDSMYSQNNFVNSRFACQPPPAPHASTYEPYAAVQQYSVDVQNSSYRRTFDHPEYERYDQPYGRANSNYHNNGNITGDYDGFGRNCNDEYSQNGSVNVDYDSFSRSNKVEFGRHGSSVYESTSNGYEEYDEENRTGYCETIDYNHGDSTYDHYGGQTTVNAQQPEYVAPVSNWNNPPPHIARTTIEQPKLFPISTTATSDYATTKLNNFVAHEPPPSTPVFPVLFPAKQSISMPEMKAALVNSHQPELSSTLTVSAAASKNAKGLPKWIIDDMKKMKEKEWKQNQGQLDFFKDQPVNSRRDEEGDIVMEDAHRESTAAEMDHLMMSGKNNVTSGRLDVIAATTETDIDDVSLHEEDDVMERVDYASKSLAELLEMLDDSEIANLKLLIIRDSLTGIMKEITDNLIKDVVKLSITFPQSQSQSALQLSKGYIDTAVKPVVEPSATDGQSCVLGVIAGLDAYESDEEQSQADIQSNNKGDNSNRQRWSTHRRSTTNAEKRQTTDKQPSQSNSQPTVPTVAKVASPVSHKHRSRSRDSSRRTNRSPGISTSHHHRHNRSRSKEGSSWSSGGGHHRSHDRSSHSGSNRRDYDRSRRHKDDRGHY